MSRIKQEQCNRWLMAVACALFYLSTRLVKLTDNGESAQKPDVSMNRWGGMIDENDFLVR